MTGEDGTSDRDGHGMGDERSGGSPDRRHARPEEPVRRRGQRSYEEEVRPSDGGPGAGTGVVHGGPATPEPKPSYDPQRPPFEALLAAAIRGEKSEGEAERRAVEAFRVARDAGAHRARTRRRDDWRPRTRRRTVRSLRTTLSVLLASLTLGGVAYATIGSVGGGPDKDTAGDRFHRPSATASAPAESPSPSAPSAPAGRPPTAKDTLAHCQVYEKLRGRGKALDSTAFQRLAEAAGGEANVSAYCAALTADASDTGAADTAKPGKRNGNAGKNADKNAAKKQ